MKYSRPYKVSITDKVLNAFIEAGELGLTDEEVEKKVPEHAHKSQSLRMSRKKLVEDGYLVSTTERATNCGKMAMVHAIK